MSNTSSVSRWLIAAKAGDSAAVEVLWRRFAKQMESLSARWLERVTPQSVFDEEDVTISAFESFRKALQDGHFDSLRGSDELWRLLATITIRKAGEFLDSEQALRRGGTAVIASLDQSGATNSATLPTLHPGPEVVAMMTEECRRLLDLLADPELEAIVMWKLEGLTNEEIAYEIGYSRRSVQRMLNRIREIWRNEVRAAE